MYQTYHCKYTGKKVASPALKPVLRHFLFFFGHFGGYVVSIGCTFAKIRAKKLLRLL